ncbi:hypothetical protein Bca4012_075964 [Brassica carinata]
MNFESSTSTMSCLDAVVIFGDLTQLRRHQFHRRLSCSTISVSSYLFFVIIIFQVGRCVPPSSFLQFFGGGEVCA